MSQWLHPFRGLKATLYQQLALTLLDKLLIAIVVAVAAFLLNRSLERFKSTQAFSAELAKHRVNKIAEVWSDLGSLRNAALTLSINVAHIETQKRNNKPVGYEYDVAAEWKKLNDRLGEARAGLDAAFFWIGKGSHRRCAAYLKTVARFARGTVDHHEEFPPTQLSEALAEYDDSVIQLIERSGRRGSEPNPVWWQMTS